MLAVMIKGLPGLVIVPVSWPNVPGSNRCVRTHSSHLSFGSMIEESGWLIGACSQAWVADSSRIFIFNQSIRLYLDWRPTDPFRLSVYCLDCNSCASVIIRQCAIAAGFGSTLRHPAMAYWRQFFRHVPLPGTWLRILVDFIALVGFSESVRVEYAGRESKMK